MPLHHEHETASGVAYRRSMQSRSLDQAMARLAERQYGVVSRTQLLRVGLTKSGIDRRIRAGRLYLLHPGVYALGHRVVPREGRWLAAVLRAGEGAVLSHRSGAELWGIRRSAANGRIDISAPRSARSSPAIERHHVQLTLDETTFRHRIPVTTLARTLFDVAAMLSEESFEAVLREAEYLHRFRLESLEGLLERHPRRRGATRIKACLRRLGGGPRGRTRSRLEARFAALLARIQLPQPDLNVLLDVDGFKIEADCLWREQRVIVELDGGKAHRTRAAFEADRERDRRLQAAGWRVIRVTWRQLDDPAPVLADLSQLLQSRLHSPVI
jgi:hypothetical protein